MTDTPILYLEKAIVSRLQAELKNVKAIAMPDRNGELGPNQSAVLRAGWIDADYSRMSAVLPRTWRSPLTFRVLIEAKDLRAHDVALQFIERSVYLLSGFHAVKEITPLNPVRSRFDGQNRETRHWFYSALFSAELIFTEGAIPSVTTVNKDNWRI